MQKTILVAGGTGLIGSLLIPKLLELGWTVNVLSRTKRPNTEKINFFQWNPSQQEMDSNAFVNVSAVVNLSGRGINDRRWTNKFKEELIESRIKPTRTLVTYANKLNDQIKTFVNSSAVGFYGLDRQEELLTEESSPVLGDFFSDLCLAWEREVHAIQSPDTKTVILRTGIVLNAQLGAYVPLKNLVLSGLASPVASGNQYFSWIHSTDLVNIILESINNSNYQGTYNAVSPNPITNSKLMRSIANSLNKPILLPKVPGFVLKLFIGGFSEALIGGLKVIPTRLIEQGFHFKYSTIEDAVRQLNWSK